MHVWSTNLVGMIVNNMTFMQITYFLAWETTCMLWNSHLTAVPHSSGWFLLYKVSFWSKMFTIVRGFSSWVILKLLSGVFRCYTQHKDLKDASK